MIVTLDQIKAQLNFTDALGAVDDALLTLKIDAAQDLLQGWLGYQIEVRYGGEDQEPVPAALKEAVLQLAAHLYENREAAADGLRALPFATADVIDAYRDRSF